GLIILGNSVGMALGPWWGGFVYDLMGSYTLAFGGAILAAALACLSVFLANPNKPLAVSSQPSAR
ncbi:MAG: MFS transporter, partial [Candidatus Methylomirabilales bacterium]